MTWRDETRVPGFETWVLDAGGLLVILNCNNDGARHWYLRWAGDEKKKLRASDADAAKAEAIGIVYGRLRKWMRAVEAEREEVGRDD